MASNKMKLYYWLICKSIRVIWLIKEMRVESDFELVPLQPGKDKDAAYCRDVHPNFTIPALVIPGGRTMLDSGAICLYLADLYGELVPESKDKSGYYDMIMYTEVTLDPLLDFYYGKWFRNEESSAEKENTVHSKLEESLNYLSTRLEGNTFINGDSLTAADCVLGYSLISADNWEGGELLKGRDKLHAYLDRLRARPAYQEAYSMSIRTSLLE